MNELPAEVLRCQVDYLRTKVLPKQMTRVQRRY